MATLVVSPNAHPETSSVDGWTRRWSSSGTITWADVHDGNGTTAGSTDVSNAIAYINMGTTSPLYVQIWRSPFVFDASAIIGTIINSITFSLYITSRQANFSGSTYNIYKCTTASNTNIAIGDYQLITNTEYATRIGGTQGQYNTWTYNATGLADAQAAIDSNGILKLGVREATYDGDNVEPTWQSGGSVRILGNYADNGSNIPYLTINYTPRSGINPYYLYS